MKWLLIFGFAVFFVHPVRSQDSTLLSAADSAQVLEEMRILLDSVSPAGSYALLSVSVGNRLFSARNNFLNTQQNSASLVVTPAFSYMHQSGFNASVAACILNEPKRGFQPSQYIATIGYDLPEGTGWGGGVSYSHYFVHDNYSAYVSPVQSDFYGYVSYEKGWLQPGLAAGYSTGNYGIYRFKDTVINSIRRFVYDSSMNQLKSFSLMATLSRQFHWFDLFRKDDGLQLSTQLTLNMGSSRTSITHRTNAPLLLNLLNKRGRLKRERSSAFSAESIGCNLDLSYMIGKFTVEPNLYLDYYLQDTESSRFSQVFTLNLSYSF